MKENVFFRIIFLLLPFAFGCTLQTTAKASSFPLNKGTTWIYSYEAYEPTTADPNQIIKATYQLTESVVETETISTYLVAHVKREDKLVNADVGWTGDLSNQPKEFWYVVNDNQVFHSNQLLDIANINFGDLILDYEFPLSVKKSWCLLPKDPNDPNEIAACDFIGKREIVSQGPYDAPAGSFDDCYDMVDYFNGGNIFQKFCSSVGVVSIKFDHAGTRFGFEQTLLSYSVGAP